MNDVYKIVTDLDLPNGHTKRMNCPACGGNNTFTVSNNMGSLMWNCYKVSCTTKGNTQTNMTAADIRTQFNRHASDDTLVDDFELPNYIVPHRDRRSILMWCAEWGIDADELGVMYDVKEDRVVFPVIHGGVVVDATGRALSPHRKPKWKRYGNCGLPYTFGSGSVAVVVEDCVSAAVVGYGDVVGVALLGTSLSESHKKYLSRFSTAIIALDPDALPKTLTFAKDLRRYVNTVRVLRLTDDLKYRNATDLTNLTNIIGE